jgi:hypothetical protein
MDISGQFHAHGRVLSGKNFPVTQKIADFVGSRTDFEVLEKG